MGKRGGGRSGACTAERAGGREAESASVSVPFLCTWRFTSTNGRPRKEVKKPGRPGSCVEEWRLGRTCSALPIGYVSCQSRGCTTEDERRPTCLSEHGRSIERRRSEGSRNQRDSERDRAGSEKRELVSLKFARHPPSPPSSRLLLFPYASHCPLILFSYFISHPQRSCKRLVLLPAACFLLPTKGKTSSLPAAPISIRPTFNDDNYR